MMFDEQIWQAIGLRVADFQGRNQHRRVTAYPAGNGERQPLWRIERLLINRTLFII